MVSDNKTQAEIHYLSPDDITRNEDNPRIIFYEDRLDILKTSIDQLGILVPLTVFNNGKKSKSYTILDGERRWKCSVKLNLPKIPCIIYPKPSRQENIIYMFQIHNTRDPWELVPTALKLEVLIRTLNTQRPTEIAKITGLKPARIKDCLRILKFPKKYLDLTLIKDPKRRIRGEFLSELEEWLEKISDSDYNQIGMTKWNIVDAMIEKYQNGSIKNLLSEFRLLRKVLQVSPKIKEKKRINKQIKKYVKSTPELDKKTHAIKVPAMSAQDLYEQTTFNVQAEEDIIKQSQKLYDILYKFNINDITDQEPIRRSLKHLKNIIEEILSV